MERMELTVLETPRRATEPILGPSFSSSWVLGRQVLKRLIYSVEGLAGIETTACVGVSSFELRVRMGERGEEGLAPATCRVFCSLPHSLTLLYILAVKSNYEMIQLTKFGPSTKEQFTTNRSFSTNHTCEVIRGKRVEVGIREGGHLARRT